MVTNKVWMGALVALATMGAAPAGAQDAPVQAAQGLSVSPATPQAVQGPLAALLMQALPPAPIVGGSADEVAKLKKHFRSLTLTAEGGQGSLVVECSDAEWVAVGHGRAAQYALVASEPSCSLTYADELEGVAYTGLETILEQAKAANAIEVVLSHPPVINVPCRTRLCK